MGENTNYHVHGDLRGDVIINPNPSGKNIVGGREVVGTSIPAGVEMTHSSGSADDASASPNSPIMPELKPGLYVQGRISPEAIIVQGNGRTVVSEEDGDGNLHQVMTVPKGVSTVLWDRDAEDNHIGPVWVADVGENNVPIRDARGNVTYRRVISAEDVSAYRAWEAGQTKKEDEV